MSLEQARERKSNFQTELEAVIQQKQKELEYLQQQVQMSETCQPSDKVIRDLNNIKKMDEFVFYKDRPDWQDIEPIPEFEPCPPIAPIDYSDMLVDIMGYFRAILLKEEISERAFQLTKDVISVSPGFYTAWYYRKLCIDQLNLSLDDEISYLNKIGIKNAKNYQIWSYRRQITQKRGIIEGECEFVEQVLGLDAKNVHAWGYRQWLIQQYQLWSKELEYTSNLIEDDSRNNSVWNQRFFVLLNINDSELNIKDQQGITKELNYALEYAKIIPNNESVWNYIKGLFNPKFTQASVQDYWWVKDILLQILKEAQDTKYLLSFLSFWYEKEGKTEISKHLCTQLASLDYIRQSYWNWRAEQLSQQPSNFSKTDIQLCQELNLYQITPGVMFRYYLSKT